MSPRKGELPRRTWEALKILPARRKATLQELIEEAVLEYLQRQKGG